MADIVFKMFDGFELPIPDLFEKIWGTVATAQNQRSHYNLGAVETRNIYGWEEGSTAISAFRITEIQTGVVKRCIIIRYEDHYAEQQQFTMHHTSEEDKYRLALPLTRSLASPLDVLEGSDA
jgi:hypothetical protein